MNTFVQAEIWTVAHTNEGNAVLVRPIGSDLAVPIFIGQAETQSILIGFGGVVMPRPLTHDLVLEIFKRLHTKLLRVEINDLRDSTFFARLVLEQGKSELMIDSRPSDALALAVRQKCPVFIAENVVDSAGVSVNLVIDEAEQPTETVETPDSQTQSGLFQSRRDELLEELNQAVEVEDYERAAVIRDILKKEASDQAESIDGETTEPNPTDKN